MIALMILRGVIMKRFVQGADRGQSTLLPECLDDWIDEENPVRVIDAFVDALDLGDLGSMASSRQQPEGPPSTPRFS
jgi:transposase